MHRKINMNIVEKIEIKSLVTNDSRLPILISDAIGNPSQQKILAVINSYQIPKHKIIGAFHDELLVGMVGILKTNGCVTIRHISISRDWRKQGIGRLLINHLKNNFLGLQLLAETDESSLGFYTKQGFNCQSFIGSYGNTRYKCEISL